MMNGEAVRIANAFRYVMVLVIGFFMKRASEYVI